MRFLREGPEGVLPMASRKKQRKRPPRRRYSFDLKLRAVKLYLEEGYSAELIAEELGRVRKKRM